MVISTMYLNFRSVARHLQVPRDIIKPEITELFEAIDQDSHFAQFLECYVRIPARLFEHPDLVYSAAQIAQALRGLLVLQQPARNHQALLVACECAVKVAARPFDAGDSLQ